MIAFIQYLIDEPLCARLKGISKTLRKKNLRIGPFSKGTLVMNL